MKILVAGLTPADQKTLVFDGFRIDEVNRAAEVHWSLSGKVINTGVGVARLGGEVRSTVVAPLGGERFFRFEAELENLGVDCRIVRCATATRNCTTLIDRTGRTITELVENSPPLADSELDEFERFVAEELPEAGTVVFSGTIPKNCPNDFYRRILENRLPENCRIVCDLQGKVLLELLPLKPFLVKPNREELSMTLQRPLKSEPDLIDGMREINRRGAVWCLVTDGARAIWLSGATEVYRFEPIRLDSSEIVNPIGCGDSMTAALAWSLHRGDSVLDAVRFGIGASTFNLKQMMPCRLDFDAVFRYAQMVGFVKK